MEEQSQLSYIDAVSLIEGQHKKMYLIKTKEFFLGRLKNISETDYEGKGLCYYYLLKIDLQRALTTETETQKHLFSNMLTNFRQQEKNIISSYNTKKELISKMQLIAFYKLMEGYFGAIEYLFDQHDAVDLVERSYQNKMDFRKSRFFVEKRYTKWLEYILLKISCNYGNSFSRWGLTGLFFIFSFAIIYFLSDPAREIIIQKSGSIFDYLYFSIVTFTTLGYGDITPLTGIQKFFCGIEVFLGYIQLGLFVTLIQKKF